MRIIDYFKPEFMLTFEQMWLGTYPSNPSYLLSTGEHLGEYLKKHPELVGKSVHDRWGPEIPFLPKASPKAKNYSVWPHR